ncbi:MAG: EI24 domain-containing protein [Nannocystaceae bacterium]
MTTSPTALERAVMELLAAGHGGRGWHELATRLSSYDVPRQPGLMEVLALLVERRWASREGSPEGSGRWALTSLGAAVLRGAGPAEIADAELATRLRAGPRGYFPWILGRLADPAGLEADLRRLLVDPSAVDAVVRGVVLLPTERRRVFVRELAQDARKGVAEALLAEWGGDQLEVQGQGSWGLVGEDVGPLLRAGLGHPAPEVRAQAAGLVFTTASAEAWTPELLANLSHPSPHLRAVTALALGSAADEASRAALARLLADDDAFVAGRAVRALAARPDGRALATAALDDPRPDVRASASYGLAVAERVRSSATAGIGAPASVSPASAASLEAAPASLEDRASIPELASETRDEVRVPTSRALASARVDHGTGLRAGVGAALRGLRRALGSRALRRTYLRLLLALWVLSIALAGGLIALLWTLTPIADGAGLGALAGLWALRIVGSLLAVIAGSALALFTLNIALPRLSERVFFAAMATLDEPRAAALRAREGMSLPRSIRMSATRLFYFLAWTALAFALTLVPVIGAILGPIVQLGSSSRILTWELLDPVFDRRDMDLGAQRSYLARHRASVLGFGLPYALMMSIPLVGPMLFGLAQAAAASLYVEVLEPAGELEGSKRRAT